MNTCSLSSGLFYSQQKYRQKATASKQILMDTSLGEFLMGKGNSVVLFCFKSYIIQLLLNLVIDKLEKEHDAPSASLVMI